MVLRDYLGLALFVWSVQQYRKDGRAGQLNCSIFRNEGTRRSSEIILEAERRAIARWGSRNAFTFIDPEKISSRNPGYCFKCAGWRFTGTTGSGLHCLEKFVD